MGDKVRKNITLLTVLVCIAGIITGALFGRIMGSMGAVWGAIGGLAAGLTWTKSMSKRIARGMTLSEYLQAGTWRGILVGLLATVILHCGLNITKLQSIGTSDYYGMLPMIAVIAVMCAMAGGSVTGLLCGLLAHRLTRPNAAEKSPTQSDANS